MQRLNKLNKTQIIAAFCIQSLLKAGKQKTLDNKVAEADLVYCSAYPFGWISKSNRLTTRGSIWVMKNPWLGPCTAKLCSVPPLHIYLWTLLSKQLAQQNCRGCYICMTYEYIWSLFSTTFVFFHPTFCFQSAKQGWMWTHMPSMARSMTRPFPAWSWLEWRSCMHMASLVKSFPNGPWRNQKNQNKKTCNKTLGKESHHFNHFTKIHFFFHLVIFKLSWLIPRPPPCSPPCSPASGSASIVPMLVVAISSWTLAMAGISQTKTKKVR